MSVIGLDILLSRKSYACTSTAVKLFWAAVNAVKLLNLTVLEPFVNDMTILTASIGTFEQYRSRKRRMLYHMFNRDGFLPCLS